MESLTMTTAHPSDKAGLDGVITTDNTPPTLANTDHPTACLEHTDYHALAKDVQNEAFISAGFSNEASLPMMADPLWSLDPQASNTLCPDSTQPVVNPVNSMVGWMDSMGPEQALLAMSNPLIMNDATSNVGFMPPFFAFPPTPPKGNTPPKMDWPDQGLIPPWQVLQPTPALTPNVHGPHDVAAPQPQPSHTRPTYRRQSADQGSEAPKPRRRTSSQPSVASVVSLSAHEPVEKIIDGVQYITFLYSHDRLVREYTVCTNVDAVHLQDIPLDFRAQNAIYPRANVPRSEYDGNRWVYETSCNELGWKLCWLNKPELCGKRGLIQRAVDSYRNRHLNMRSRRVTRQEKVANGTLRKRRSRKSS